MLLYGFSECMLIDRREDDLPLHRPLTAREAQACDDGVYLEELPREGHHDALACT